MSRVIAVVEGQTEQGFVESVLAPFLAGRGVYLTARIVGKPGHKGGVGRYERARKDILLLLRQEGDTAVTTMFDFYGMPESWPGRPTAKRASSAEKSGMVEAAIREDILGELGASFPGDRFRPYVQMHEFESLLYCGPPAVCAVLRSPESEAELWTIRNAFENPEEINDNPDTAPSKRLLAVFADYRKRLHGVIAAQRIGIDVVRRECPHFAQWLQMLESLGQEATSAP